MKSFSLILVTIMIMVSMTVNVDAGSKKFSAKLSGDQVVPPTDSKGSATVNFIITKFGYINYEIMVSNLENIVSAHIRLAAVGSEGPITVVLLQGIPVRSGKFSGQIHLGSIFPADLLGPFEGSRTLNPLLSAIRSGNTYVTIATSDGSGDQRTGPGNFPDGEVRGQIR